MGEKEGFNDYPDCFRVARPVLRFHPSGRARLSIQLVTAPAQPDAKGEMIVELLSGANAHKKAGRLCPQSAWVGSAARFV